jgi:hypothetical protein
MKNIHKIGKELFITSDEEIKEGDYYITPNNTVLKALGPMLINVEDYKKIILTTDFRLAPDVQKIDDEFLEWFEKNPSCEEVKVENVYKTASINFGNQFNYYKIIIPQEEPKQETLEEASYNYARDKMNRTSHLIGFRAGAKWQQEQKKNLYSEEDVISFGEFIFKHTLLAHCKGVKNLFEQFKKK